MNEQIRNKKALFIISCETEMNMLYNLKTGKKTYLSNSALMNYIDNTLFWFLKKENISTITIFTLDLTLMFKWFKDNISYDNIKTFKFKNRIYSLTYKNVLYPQKRLIFKDIAHFIYNVSKENILNYIPLLILFANKILKEFQIDIFCSKILSLTSLSNAIFKKICPEKYNNIKSLNEKEDNFIRKSYYGGRGEIIKPLINNTYLYDINSLYPFIMCKYEMPIKKPIYITNVNFTQNFYGFIDVLVEAPFNIELPMLPVKSENNHAEMGILYPKGRWRGVYFSEELKLAVKYGYKIVETYDGYFFEKGYLFNTMIERLYNLRYKEENKKVKGIIKNMMNSLYGKFACIYKKIKVINQNEDNYEEVITKKYENIAIAAAITSLGRCFMYEYIIQNKLDLYYWDTDGIIIGALLTQNVGNNLGQFRLVTEIIEGVCLSPKFYLFRTTKQYSCILRSIKQDLYEINPQSLRELFLKEIEKFPEYRFDFTISITLYIKNEDTKKILTFTFINKRKYKKVSDKIISYPWTIGTL